MVRFLLVLVVVVFTMTIGAAQVSADVGMTNGNAFSWFFDDDGDGIPNGLDDDWTRPEDGSGQQLKNRFGASGVGAFSGDGTGSAYKNQNRYRKNGGSTLGDYLKIRLQLRDGSCK